MCCGGGDTTTTTIVQPAAKSQQELELIQQQIDVGEFQLQQLQAQSTAQAQFAKELEPLLAQQLAQSEAAAAEQERLAPIREELLTLALEDLRQGGAATPEQIELIEEAGSAALARGETDIERFRTEGLTALREELAPSLGLRPSDTPILDRGALLASEALRQSGQLSQGIRGAEATAQLNFPLASSQLLQTSALGQQSLQEAIRQFQEQLRSQAFTNRLAATQSLGGLGLGLAGAAQPVFPNFGQGFTSTATTTGGGGSSLGEVGQLAGGVGGLLSGISAFGPFGASAAGFGGGVTSAGLAALAFSSRELKTDKVPVDEDVVLEKVAELPVETWRYKPDTGLDDERHIGTYAENFKEGFGIGDGVRLNLMDTTGVTFAAIKALDKKVKLLESGLGLAK